ncbi:MAG: hypothetical protein ACYTER_09545 [Planctomycetota bacterium]|jgi:hypothetical protein
MNQLEKKAWAELIFVLVIILFVSIPGILYCSEENAQGWGWLIVCVLISGPMILNGYLSEVKNMKQFDERQQAILRQSFSIFASVFIFYLLIFSFALFFLIGGGERVPVVWMPMMVLTGIVLAQCAQSIVILIQCAKEDDE